MSHVNRNLKAGAGDVAEDVSQSVSSLSHAVVDKTHAAGHRVAQTAGQVADAVGQVVDAVEDKGEQLGHVARDAFTHGRDRALWWEHKFERAVRSRPIVSLLIAAGIGAVAGAVGVTLLRRRI